MCCETCGAESAVYKCPRCGYFSCSLECCKKHKIEKNCNGKRDRTDFVPSHSLLESTLRNDYHLLEDILQSKDSARRISQNHFGAFKDLRWQQISASDNAVDFLSRKKQSMQHLSKGLRKLISETKLRGMNLCLMPSGMSKRIGNNTSYISAQKTIKWKVQTIFLVNARFVLTDLFSSALESAPSSSSSSSTSQHIAIVKDSLVGIPLDAVDENEKIDDILRRFFDNRPGNGIQRHALRALRVAGRQLRCLIQKIPSPANNPVFIELNLDWTLKEALKGKTVIEYPTLYFGLPETTSHLNSLISEHLPCDKNEILLPDLSISEGVPEVATVSEDEGGGRHELSAEEPQRKKLCGMGLDGDRIEEEVCNYPPADTTVSEDHKCTPGEVPPVRGPTDKTLLSLPLADYQSDSASDSEGDVASILRVVHRKGNDDGSESKGIESRADQDTLKSRLVRFNMQKSSMDRESLGHCQPERMEEAVEETMVDSDEDEVEEGEIEEGDAGDVVTMEDGEESEGNRDSDVEDEEEGDDDDVIEEDGAEVIELDSEGAGLFAAFAALRGQNSDVLKALLGNLPLPPDDKNC